MQSVTADGAALRVTTRVQLKRGGLPSAAALVALLRAGKVFPAATFGAVDSDFIVGPYWASAAGGAAPASPDLAQALAFTASYAGAAASWLTSARAAEYKAAVAALLPGACARAPCLPAAAAGHLAAHHPLRLSLLSAAALHLPPPRPGLGHGCWRPAGHG